MDLAVWWVIHNRCSLSEEQGGSCVVTGGSQSPDKQRSVLDDKQGSHLSTMQLVPILLLEKAFYISQDIWYFSPICFGCFSRTACYLPGCCEDDGRISNLLPFAFATNYLKLFKTSKSCSLACIIQSFVFYLQNKVNANIQLTVTY